MSSQGRWQRCIEHRKDSARKFVLSYFHKSENRRVGFIGAAGFDPRSCTVADLLAETQSRVEAYFIREERFVGEAPLLAKADGNLSRMQKALPGNEVLRIKIFGEGNAVVGGRTMAAELHKLRQAGRLQQWTDVVIDATAFSIGISFPLIRFFLEQASRGHPQNVHVFLAADPGIDNAVVPIASDIMTPVHGFAGGLTLHDATHAAKLWLPQLAMGRSAMLETIYRTVNPDDVCPILPFPSYDPRAGDSLIAHYLDEFQSGWEVDGRDIIYAGENDPQDLYRTLRRLHELRHSVFQEVGGSVVILSPMGNKALALGALMAAYELGFAVAYVESEGYDPVNIRAAAERGSSPELIHLWLAGDVYADVPAGLSIDAA